jgi:hypothetical protein
MPISISRGLMLLALFVLAYLVYMTMSDCDSFGNQIASSKNKLIKMFEKKENFKQTVNPSAIVPQLAVITENFQASEPKELNESQPKINYEHFQANVNGVADSVYSAAPLAGKANLDDSKYATVKYTGMVDGKPGDVIQIEGTDLLTAPLVDNMLYTNSIANTNRNASQDLRGDIPLQFNDTYTPFYSSVIYGAPLSQKQMTIGNL